MQKDAALAMMASRIAVALITTATGVLVAVPAVWTHNYLRACIDMLESEMSNMAREAITHLKAHPQWRSRREHFDTGSKSIVSGADADACSWDIRYDDQRSGRCFQFAQRLPLARRFSEMPAFALMAAPWLAVVVAVFIMISSSSYTPTGLEVSLLKPGGRETRDHFSVEPIVIGVVNTSTNGSPAIYVNSKKTPWDELGNTVRRKLKVRPQWIAYIEAENNVPWADVANVIDVVAGLHADVVLLTIRPDIDSSHMHRPAP
jgi:biopolymer transport protein ExbD